MLPSFAVFAEEDEIDIWKIDEIINYIEYQYKEEVPREVLVEGAYRGIMDTLDKHSKYFSESEYDEFLDNLYGELIGIGIYIEEENGYVKVITPVDGSPAKKAGILTGDIITHVDGQSVLEIGYDKAINMIKGEAGTSVKITINRDDEIMEMDIIREVILIPDVRIETLEDGIGYMRIVQFGRGVAEEVDNSLLELKAQGMTSLIIDLRNNPGGYLDEVINIADRFVDVGDEIVHVDYRNFTDKTSKGLEKALDIPLAVLINDGSASASEILAGAIQYNDKGIIIGERSYGKGSVQSLLRIRGGSAIKLTTAEYFSANMKKVDGVGITPDIFLTDKLEESADTINSFAPMIEKEIAHFGVTGLNVFGAQQRLKFLGYDVDTTGMYDLKTSLAINDFQEKNNLKDKSALYQETINALEKEVASYLLEDPQLEKAKELLLNAE